MKKKKKEQKKKNQKLKTTKKISKPKKITKKIKKPAKVRKATKKLSSLPKIEGVKGAKLIGKVEHYFGKISVAAIKMLGSLKVGDRIQIKGHTTDFEQLVESIQIDHQSVNTVKKGEEIGIRVKDSVREHDLVFLKPEAQKEKVVPTAILAMQQPMFPKIVEQKPLITQSVPPKALSTPDPYKGKKFFKF